MKINAAANIYIHTYIYYVYVNNFLFNTYPIINIEIFYLNLMTNQSANNDNKKN